MKKWITVAAVLCLLGAASYAGTGDIHRVQNPAVGHYIAVLMDNIDPTAFANEVARARGLNVTHVYSHAIKGISFFATEAVARAIHLDARVLYVQEASTIALTGLNYPAPSWGLDRIDQQYLPLDGWYRINWTGVGVTIYVVDSGINDAGGIEFGSRLIYNENFVSVMDSVTHQWFVNPGDYADTADHGTSVASIAAGTTYGVAPGANVVNLRAAGGANRSEDFVAAIDKIYAMQVGHVGIDAVANFSWISYGIDPTIEAAIQHLIDGASVVVVVSAGDMSANACNYTPARMGSPASYQPNPNQYSVITVGQTTSADAMVPSSNTGPCVDVLAPGQGITARKNNGTVNTAFSGTSASAPHVAGDAAARIQYFRTNNITFGPNTIEGMIKDNGTPNVVTGVPADTPNLLLWQGMTRRRAG